MLMLHERKFLSSSSPSKVENERERERKEKKEGGGRNGENRDSRIVMKCSNDRKFLLKRC